MQWQQIQQQILEQVAQWTPKLAGVLVTIIVFYVLIRISRGLITKAATRLELDIHLTTLLIRSNRITLLVFGFVTVLGTLGIDVAALVAGLGLTGFALGFALRDTISNLLSGVMILLYRPFNIGDQIKIAGFEGQVTAIDLRYTQLNDTDHKVLIPNAKLFTDPITVVAQQPSNHVSDAAEIEQQ